jgi:hypothetical protein
MTLPTSTIPLATIRRHSFLFHAVQHCLHGGYIDILTEVKDGKLLTRSLLESVGHAVSMKELTDPLDLVAWHDDIRGRVAVARDVDVAL